MDKLQQTIRTYNKIAPRYAQQVEPYIDLANLKLFTDHLTPKAYILDVGCGSGRDCAYFNDLGFTVIGIDLSEGLLNEATKLHSGLNFQLMDMRQLAFDDGSFEGVWAYTSLLHLDRADLAPTIVELSRVTKTGGYVFVKMKAREDMAQTQKFAFGEERYYTYASLAELKGWFERAGLTVIHASQHNDFAIDPTARDVDWITIIGRKHTQA